ncbi:PVC-type heme-binding CxxCH protein [Paludisphaera rhizosphaerae]|uniref:PVC-type heme-binding CxxCH protein n=1 Tax=Paludisphaera rhizosphaerae TaxID=2711216 RepID=UPI0013ED3726|nr:PVC-type heme-binding CxxCH protein [Paludisphaera rhizosphaerae]
MRVCAAFSAALVLVWLGSTSSYAQGYAPDVAAAKMIVPDGLAVNLYASEPNVRQPILLKSDDRGRIWTVQYLQYPNPAGLTRVKVDRYSRTVYDRVPEPPPKGPRGADRITICEDTDGDGRADRFKDFVDGLNLCTGLEFARDGVYVLQAPYLLFYPDRNRDDVSDGDPEVVLAGFGLEDAQSLVNHLTWGPDGWLYGATGSTVTNVVRGVEFQQAVWRVHPASREFELFCEGGGNLYGLTFDAEGTLFFSSNGVDLAYHAVQGGYYRKNFGKHGPLHNLHTYGFFEHLPYDRPVAGPRPGGTIYLGQALPASYRGALLCSDFLQHSASYWELVRRGSTFEAQYGGLLLNSRDNWFCAPDLCQGIDGAVYVCDFHDRRTAHPDPDAQWDRSNGRIYRITAKEGGRGCSQSLDLTKRSGAELIGLTRRADGPAATAIRLELAARRDPTIRPALLEMSRQTDDPLAALRGLWALNAVGGFNDDSAADLLRHPAEAVRAWTVRLLGDSRRVSPSSASRLAEMAGSDPSASVRLQLAATARRLPGEQGLPILESLLRRGADRDDAYIPLMIWWGLEAKAMTDADRLVRTFREPSAWADAVYRENALRLTRRYAAEGTQTGYDACTRLLASSPEMYRAAALDAVDHGLAERSTSLGGMGTAGLFGTLAAPEPSEVPGARAFEPISAALAEAIDSAWRATPTDLARLRLAMRADRPGAVAFARAEAAEPNTPPARRVALLGLLAEFGDPESASLAFAALSAQQPEVQSAALDVLARFGDDRTAAVLVDRYKTAGAPLRARLRTVMLGRPVWARVLLGEVESGAIPTSDFALAELRQVSLHNDSVLDALVRKHWGSVKAGTPEDKLAEIRRLSNDLRAGLGDHERGRALFAKNCASCHKLFGEGGEVGPDLTGVAREDSASLLASLVDPSAVIRAQFLQYAAATRDGRVLSGVIAAQDGASVTLVDSQNTRVVLRREEIEELRELPVSIMPEGLLKPLGPQEVRDLFRYLQSRPEDASRAAAPAR